MTTREHILDKAGKLIYRKGYLAASISDILAESGVGKGQLYHYFASKKAIGLEVVTRLLAQWRIELLDGILKQSNPRQALLDMIDWFFTFHQQQEVHYGCPVGNLIVELATQEADFQLLLEDFISDWVVGLATVLGKQSPNLSDKERTDLALSMISSLQGGAVLVKLQQDMHSLEAVRQGLIQQFILI